MPKTRPMILQILLNPSMDRSKDRKPKWENCKQKIRLLQRKHWRPFNKN